MSVFTEVHGPVAGWDQAEWSDAVPPCPRCGHDAQAETVALRRRAVTEAEHHELVAALLAGDGTELAPWEQDARTDALVVAYAAVLRELAAVTLASMTEADIRARLEQVLAITMPVAVLVDYRAELNRQSAQHEAAGVDPASCQTPARERVRRAA